MKNSTNIIVAFTKRFFPHIIFLIVFALVYGIAGSKEGYATVAKRCAGVTIDPVASGYRLIVMYEMSKNKGTCIVYAQDGKTEIARARIENQSQTITFYHKTGNIAVTFPRGAKTPTVTVSNTLFRDKRIHVHASCSYPKPNCALSIEVPVGRGQITAKLSGGSSNTPKNATLSFVQRLGRNNNPALVGEITRDLETNKLTGANFGVNGEVLLNGKTSIPYGVNVNVLGCNTGTVVGGTIGVNSKVSSKVSAQAGVSSDGCRLTSTVQLNWEATPNTSFNLGYKRNIGDGKPLDQEFVANFQYRF